ncbi:hypothetical protein QJQ45_021282 [Haematococcus lacustris]|nr:hypothetical protein QJQ45_021282 [Haematococcus lacustris]
MEHHGHAKQLVVFFEAAGIGTRGGSAVNRQQPCQEKLNKLSATRPAAPQAPRSSQPGTQPAASEPGPSTPLPARRSKRTEAEQAAEPTQPTKDKGKAQGKAAKAKPTPQPGRWLDRDCNSALNMQRIGESRWWPLELCYWPKQAALPAKGKEYPDLGYKGAKAQAFLAAIMQHRRAITLAVALLDVAFIWLVVKGVRVAWFHEE